MKQIYIREQNVILLLEVTHLQLEYDLQMLMI